MVSRSGGGDWIVRMMERREQWDRCRLRGIEGGHIRSRIRLIGMASPRLRW